MATTLPTELIELIFSFADRNDKPSCAAICLTNKLGHRVATPLLYRSIGAARPDLSASSRALHLQHLCETFLKDPNLVDHVLEVRHYLHTSSMQALDLPLLYDYEAYCQAFRDHNVEPIIHDILLDENADEFRNTEERMLMILLILCQRARVLHLEYEHHTLLDFNLGSVIHAVNRSHANRDLVATDPSYGLFSIEEVNLNQPERCEPPDADDIMAMLPLPRLKRLAAWSLGEGSISPYQPETISLASNLQELELRNYLGSQNEIRHLIPNCPQLKILDVQWKSWGTFRQSLWASLGRAIRKYTPLLEHMHFNCAELELKEDESFRVTFDRHIRMAKNARQPLGLGPLQSLKSLKTMTVPQLALWQCYQDIDDQRTPCELPGPVLEAMLPASLKELVVLYEGTYESNNFERDARVMLADSVVARLDSLTVIDRRQNRRVSSTDDVADVEARS